MNAEARLKQSIDNADYLCVTGSRLYGCERYDESGQCISDLDIRGVTIPPLEYLIGLKNWDESPGDESDDHKVFSLQKFLSMTLKGNFQTLEMLFVPREKILRISPVGEQLLSIRDKLISKVCYRAITGYSYSEWFKVRGVRKEPVKRTQMQGKALDAVWNAFPGLTKTDKDLIKSTVYSNHEYVEVDCRNQVGEKRRVEYDKYGYCASCAHHAIRCLFQCRELMADGFLTFPRPEVAILKDVKAGKLTFNEVEKVYLKALDDATYAFERSSLPETPDHKGVWKWWQEVTTERVRSELGAK